MTDVTVTAASVRPLGNAIVERFTASAAIDVGAPVSISGNGTVAAADGSTVAGGRCIGVMVAVQPNGASTTAAASGEEVDVVTHGRISGCGCVANTPYYVDDDAGIISDTAGTKSTLVGIGIDTDTLMVRPELVDLA